MRMTALASLILCLALLAAACGGPDDPEQSLSDACERQLEEISEETTGTPTAKSSEDRLDEVTLSECAGQKIHLEPDGEGEGEDGSSRDGDGEEDGSTEDTGDVATEDGDDGGGDGDGGAGGPTAAVALDPESRDSFAQACGVCHTLSDADSSGQVGPNLDETNFDADMVEQRIIEGAPGMPPNLLEGEEARAVAEYVAAAASQAQQG